MADTSEAYLNWTSFFFSWKENLLDPPSVFFLKRKKILDPPHVVFMEIVVRFYISVSFQTALQLSNKTNTNPC